METRDFLTEKERTVWTARIQGKTYKECAAIIGMSQEWTRAIFFSAQHIIHATEHGKGMIAKRIKKMSLTPEPPIPESRTPRDSTGTG